MHGLLSMLGCYLVANQDVIGWVVLLEITDDTLEILRLCVARATDVKFLLYEELGGKLYVLLGISDAYDATCEGYLVDSHLIGNRSAYGLDDDIGSCTSGNLLQTLVDVLLGGVDGIFGT